MIALDFLYDSSSIPGAEKAKDALFNVLKEYFTKEFDGDHLQGWDYSNEAVVAK